MKRIVIQSKVRKDGKHKVTYIYQGAKNMFGGRYPPNIFNKLHTATEIREVIDSMYEGDTVEGEELLGPMVVCQETTAP